MRAKSNSPSPAQRQVQPGWQSTTGVAKSNFLPVKQSNYANHQTKDCPNRQPGESAIASDFRKRSRTGDAPADDQVGCLITGNAADLPGCPPPPGMELN